MNSTAELLARYASGERSFRETETEDPDILELDDSNLAGADFSGSFLVGRFRRANLRGASFRDANIKTCDFSGADLTDADFRGSALDATTFEGATLKGAQFAGASICGSDMVEGELPSW